MAMTLDHPFHRHALIRRQLSYRCSFRCNICGQEVHGTAYCCEENSCTFFLDEPCALVEIPQQIEHPIDPVHSLVIDHRRYRCYPCNIILDAAIAIATMPPLEEEKRIKHAAHDHFLTAFHVKVPNWINGIGCWEEIKGLAYGCHSCLFFLHESCALSPQKMLQHPFHPEHPLTVLFKRKKFRCKACHTDKESQLAYHCEKCKFMLDVTCAFLPLHLQDQQQEVDRVMSHFCHQHNLLSGYIDKSKHRSLSCAVCQLEISGEVYHCLGCIFFIHELCAEELQKEMVHYLHPEHPLIFLSRPPYNTKDFWCHCCIEEYSGMAFHCVSCEFNLDLECALRTFSAFRDGVASKIQHLGHDHLLILRYCKMKDGGSSCKACRKPITGLAYSCGNCVYSLHKSCAELPLQLEHPLHPSHPLILLQNAPNKYFLCNNCRYESTSFAFCCSECDFCLGIRCATERPTLKHQLHEHTLSFFDYCMIENSARCNSCCKPCTVDFYHCTPCNFSLHSSCLPLPPTIQHECHPYHPLVLFDRFVDGRPDDQYCDYCEEIRNPDHGVYHCEECPYTVHIGCVLPERTQPVNVNHEELRKEIEILKKTIKEKEKDLEALYEELSRLENNLRREPLEA